MRPTERWKSVSPESSNLCSPNQKLSEPGVCPGVCSTTPPQQGSRLVIVHFMVGWRQGITAQPKCLRLLLEHIPQIAIIRVQVQAGTGGRLERTGGEDVIQMGMGVDDRHQLEPMARQAVENALHITAGIDDDSSPAQAIADDTAIALQGADREPFMDHPSLRGSCRCRRHRHHCAHRFSPGTEAS